MLKAFEIILAIILCLVSLPLVAGGEATATCQQQKDACTNPLPGQFCPQCDDAGNYKPMQCSGSTGYCWCVDVSTGAKTQDAATRNPTKLPCYSPEEN